MVELPKEKLYLLILVLMLLAAGAIAVYTYIENYIRDQRIRKKRKVVFKTKEGKTKGYWKTKKGEKYDPDLKVED